MTRGAIPTRQRLFEARYRTRERLDAVGVRTRPSSTIYLLAEVPNAAEAKAHLLRHHRIRVRECIDFGLPGFIRIATREGDAPARLARGLEALRA